MPATHAVDGAPPVTARRLTARIGAEVTGLELTRPLTDADVAHLLDLTTEHQVVFVRDQFLTEEQHRALALRFGTLTHHPLHAIVGARSPLSVIVDSVEHPPAGFTWHTDLSWTIAPPVLGILSALEIPDVGGDTLWASGPAMWDRLGPVLQRSLAHLRLVHRPDATLLATVRRHHGDDAVAALLDAHPPVTHPLVRAHPRTGRPALWISPLYTERVDGLGPADSTQLLAALASRADDPEVQVRWRWRDGDLAIWDQAATCHRALTDHHPHTRRVRRCTIEGPAPVGWDPGLTGDASNRRLATCPQNPRK